MIFHINGIPWIVRFVNPTSKTLMRSDGSVSVGCTDASTNSVYLSDALRGAFLRKVLTHELVHVVCFSYGFVVDLGTEELIADFLATYGNEILAVCEDLLERIGGVYANRRIV